MFKRKEAHTGENLYEAFAKILNEFNLQNKILAVTLDNSSNNKSLMEYLDKDESNSFSLLNHVRCFAHVLNLASQAVLMWWKFNSKKYPNLSRMARDYLAIPGTSASSERLFSSGKDLITDKRNLLSSETVRACQCLKSWI